MQSKSTKRYYSPQFSQLAAVSVRRLAWAMGKPMPKAIDIMVKLLPNIVNPSKVCQLCKDKQACNACTFSKQPNPKEFVILEAVL
jgi:recombinational DNA repair protein RecR